MKHRFVENGSRVYEDCARKRKRRKKSLEKIRFGSRIARDVQFETKNADFLLGISFYAVSIQKKVRSGNESK